MKVDFLWFLAGGRCAGTVRCAHVCVSHGHGLDTSPCSPGITICVFLSVFLCVSEVTAMDLTRPLLPQSWVCSAESSNSTLAKEASLPAPPCTGPCDTMGIFFLGIFLVFCFWQGRRAVVHGTVWHNVNTFSKVLCIGTLHRKYTRALTQCPCILPVQATVQSQGPSVFPV
jgi:hypothetical protein